MILFATDIYKTPDGPELGYCPHCFGLVWIVRSEEDEISEDVIEQIMRQRNHTQVKILLAYCRENRIRLTKEEKRRAA